MQISTLGYNERLFGAGLYGMHHAARFSWLQKVVRELDYPHASVLEIGCFDGRSVDYLPAGLARYVGLDAGWESTVDNGVARGLAAAEQRFANDTRFEFLQSDDPQDITKLSGEFDLAVSLETFEHIAPDTVDAYLAAIAAKLRGPLLLTVPNEIGIALLVKTAYARILRIDRGIPYGRRELINSILGRIERVVRREHKGFDYRQLVSQIRQHFRDVQVSGISPRLLPQRSRLTIGIVAKN